MADVDPIFNPELDRITEREVVFDFVSRIKYGRDFKSTEEGFEDLVIFSPPRFLKDMLRKDVMSFPKTIAHNMDNILTSHRIIKVGEQTITVTMPSKCRCLLLAYSERLQQDLTSLFTKNDSTYTLTLDVPYEPCIDPEVTAFYGNNFGGDATYSDIIKFYWLYDTDQKVPENKNPGKAVIQ